VSEINVNGRILNSKEVFAGKDHRGLKYGDGLFESIRMLDGKMPLLPDHMRRLYRGLQLLKIKKPKYFTTAFFRKEIQKITRSEKNTRIRITIFRASGGLYTPTNNHPFYLIEYQPIKSNNWEWSKKGLKIKVCPTVQLPITTWSGLKTTNSLPYILAGLWKQEQKIDDCILLNQLGFVAEASSSNLFYFQENRLLTPTDQSGAIQGVMRHNVIKLAKINGIEVIKKEILPAELLTAEEVFLTNAVQGIRWVKEIDGVKFKNKMTKEIFVELFN